MLMADLPSTPRWWLEHGMKLSVAVMGIFEDLQLVSLIED